MKIALSVVVLILAGSALHAESLADAAKRERERREKNKAAGVEVKVIGAEELAAVPTDGGSGTFNVGTNGNDREYTDAPVKTSNGPSAPRSSAPSTSSGDDPSPRSTTPSSDSDPKRDAARQRLAARYQRIASSAAQFLRYAEAYQGCQGNTGTQCRQLAQSAAQHAINVAEDMEKADEEARRAALAPGEVRLMRAEYGMDDAYWDKLVRFVQEHRR